MQKTFLIMKFFDTHAHYDDEQFDIDRAELLPALHAAGVERIVNIGADTETSAKAAALAADFDFIYFASGCHPCEAARFDLSAVRELARREKCVAIGECGLDYYWKPFDKALQARVFIEQIELANELTKPLVVHSREAFAEVLEILRVHSPKAGGIIHCFSEGAAEAARCLELGYYIAFGGVVTFKNAEKTREALASVPLDRLLLETDCPYLAPVPFRGKRCDSGMLEHTARAIAEVKGVSVEEICEVTFENAKKIYNI